MKNWAKYAVVNLSMVLGFFASVLLLPPSAHFWLVFTTFLVFLGLVNYGLFKRLRTPNAATNRAEHLTIMAIALLMLLFDLFLGYVRF